MYRGDFLTLVLDRVTNHAPGWFASPKTKQGSVVATRDTYSGLQANFCGTFKPDMCSSVAIRLFENGRIRFYHKFTRAYFHTACWVWHEPACTNTGRISNYTPDSLLRASLPLQKVTKRLQRCYDYCIPLLHINRYKHYNVPSNTLSENTYFYGERILFVHELFAKYWKCVQKVMTYLNFGCKI